MKQYKGKYSDFGPLAKDVDRRNVLIKHIKDKDIVRLALDYGRRPSVFIKVACHDDENVCIKCALYNLETACRNYDCTGHYLKEPKNAAIEKSITTNI